MCRGQHEAAVQGLGIGIDQQFVGIKTMPRRWLVRPVDPIAVALARSHPRNMGVPDVARSGKTYAAGFPQAGLVEKAKLNLFRMRREQAEIRASLGAMGAQRRSLLHGIRGLHWPARR